MIAFFLIWYLGVLAIIGFVATANIPRNED